MRTETDRKPNFNNGLLLLFIVIFIILTLWMLPKYYFITWKKISEGNIADYYTAIGALFSGLSIPFIIYTLFQQQKEIQKQDENYQNQRKLDEVKRFENTFFQLVNLHNDIVNRLLSKSDANVFYFSYRLLKAIYDEKAGFSYVSPASGEILLREERPEKDIEQEKSLIEESYLDYFQNHNGSSLSHYFRNLYHIYKLIYLTESINKRQKQLYANILRAQLSDYEIYLLFYNSFVEDLGNPKMRFLMQEFNICKNITENKLLQTNHMQAFNEWKIELNPFTNDIRNRTYQ